MDSNPQKRKRHTYTLAEKQKIIEESKKRKIAELSKEYNCPESTIRAMIKNKKRITQALNEGANGKNSKMRGAQYPELEKAMILWLKQVRSQNVSVDGPLLKEKAAALAILLNVNGFVASNGWLENFKKRHGIVFKEAQGEAGAVDVTAVGDYRSNILLPLLSEYSEDDVFNVDETGLFWKVLPSKTMTFKGDKCTNGKLSKDRITVLVGSNMSGTEKLPLLVIGKSLKPRCFKNAKIPLQYDANKKAWMTGVIFEKWLKKWDNKLIQQKRKILLFIDNCSAHPKVKLSNINLQFFLPNATAEIQPMDQGIIKNLKVHYRKLVLRRRIAALENKTIYEINLLNAINLLHQAWKQVKQETLHNCFRKAGFSCEIVETTNSEEEDIVRLWEELRAQEEIDESITYVDYLNVDSDLITNDNLSLEEIAEAARENAQEEAVSDDEIIEDTPLPPMTRKDAYHGFDALRRYVEENISDPKAIECCNYFEEVLYQEQRKNAVQATIDQFLS